MAEDEPPPAEPATGDRTQTERLATAAERARIGADGSDRPDKGPDADDAADEATRQIWAPSGTTGRCSAADPVSARRGARRGRVHE